MSSNRFRPAATIGLAIVAVVWGAAGFAEDDPPPPAVEAVQAALDIERTLLREDLDGQARVAAERARVGVRLGESYAELDAAIERNDALLAKTLDDVRAKVAKIESSRTELLTQENELLGKIQDRLRRIHLLEERLASLQERAHDAGGPLAGRWDVSLMPSGQTGVFSLTQSGTLVSGTYQLEGGWTGSLQGTLVNRKVHLERIDSKQGRSAEFEGFVSGDGSRIRGTWRSYELSAREPASGQWSAVRRPAP